MSHRNRRSRKLSPMVDGLETRMPLSGDILLVVQQPPPTPPIGVPTITVNIIVRPPFDDPMTPTF